MKRILFLCLALVYSPLVLAQVAVAPAPVPAFRSFTAAGVPNAGGCVYTFTSTTSTPLATYTDYTGTVTNANPVVLDANGQAQIWVKAATYRFQVWTYGSGAVGSNCGGGTQLYQIDGISDVGLIEQVSGAVQLNPAGAANQTIVGPLTASQFNGPATQVTSPFTAKTASNNPTVTFTNPVAGSQNYQVPDPATPTSHFVLDTGATNTLDCTAGIVTCKRTATYYFPGASCNNATASLGWDSFPTNAPSPVCVTGTNMQKGVMGLPSAYTHLQQNTGTSTAAGTITTTYPAATVGGNGDLLIASVAFNATTTITGCTDGTNAYTQAKHIANGALSVDIWVFHNATTKTAGTTLTCTYSAAATGAIKWHEYLAPASTSTDVSASNSGTGTAVTTGTTAGTAQSTELLFAADGDLSNPTNVVNTSGYTDHTVVSATTVVQADDAGIIQQAAGAQAAAFTLGSSQTWAAAIVAIKAANAGSAIAQRTVVLPSFYNAAVAVNSAIKWTSPLAPVGTSNVVLGAALGCTADGSSDDPAFNADTTATAIVNTTGPNIPINTALSALTTTGCVASSTLHFQVKRLRYNVSDTYEGFVQVIGGTLQIGISQ